MALAVVKVKKAQAQIRDSSPMANRNIQHKIVYDVSSAGNLSQNTMIKVGRSSIQSKTRSQPNAHLQPLKRNRPIVIDESILMATKKIASHNRQPIPIHSVQKISGGNVTATPQKLVPINNFTSSGIKIEPGTMLKLGSSGNIISSGGRQYATVPANGALITSSSSPSSSKLIGQTYASVSHQQQSSSRRPTIFIKAPPKKSLRETTMELIDKSPKLHLGINADCLSILKSTVCSIANIRIVDLYMTLKKLRHNEDFILLSEYFEYPSPSLSLDDTNPNDDDNNIIINYGEILNVFVRTICKLNKYLKYLIRWPEGKKYYDRHKNLPIEYRSKLSFVQSLVECVEIELQSPLINTTILYSKAILSSSASSSAVQQTIKQTNNDQQQQIVSIPFPTNLKSYKFIITLTPNGLITFVSDVCAGYYDDIAIFNACKFRDQIPKYLSLVVDPGIAFKNKYKSKKLFNKYLKKHDDNDDDKNNKTKSSNENENENEKEKSGNKNSKKNNNNNSNNNNKNNNNNDKEDGDNNEKTQKKQDSKNKDDKNSKTSNDGNKKKTDDSNKDHLDKADNDKNDETNTSSKDKIESNTENSKTTKTNDNNTENLSDDDDYEIDNDIDTKELTEDYSNLQLTKSKLKNYISKSNNSMKISNKHLISQNVKTFKIPTIKVNNDNICRTQITDTITLMKEFKIIQSYNQLEPQLYAYLTEIITVISALVNLQR